MTDEKFKVTDARYPTNSSSYWQGLLVGAGLSTMVCGTYLQFHRVTNDAANISVPFWIGDALFWTGFLVLMFATNLVISGGRNAHKKSSTEE